MISEFQELWAVIIGTSVGRCGLVLGVFCLGWSSRGRYERALQARAAEKQRQKVLNHEHRRNGGRFYKGLRVPLCLESIDSPPPPVRSKDRGCKPPPEPDRVIERKR